MDSRCEFSFRGTWRTFDGTNGLPGPAIAFCQDDAGYLWIGTWGQGVCIYDGEAMRNLSTDDGLAGNDVWAVLEDDGVGWARILMES